MPVRLANIGTCSEVTLQLPLARAGAHRACLSFTAVTVLSGAVTAVTQLQML
jgi:hypothetical protein